MKSWQKIIDINGNQCYIINVLSEKYSKIHNVKFEYQLHCI